jgi:hypothetical protein
LISQMQHVMAFGAKPIHDSHGDTHISQKPHTMLHASGQMDFFLGEPRGVLQGLFDVLRFQIRVVCKNLVWRSSMRNLPNDERDRNAHAPDTCPATQNLRFKRDTIKLWFPVHDISSTQP